MRLIGIEFTLLHFCDDNGTYNGCMSNFLVDMRRRCYLFVKINVKFANAAERLLCFVAYLRHAFILRLFLLQTGNPMGQKDKMKI